MGMMTKSVGVLAVAALGYGAATPYITVYHLRSAAEQHDAQALSQYIEFPSVRESLKTQFNAVLMKQLQQTPLHDNPMAALGATFAGLLVDKIVEAYVTPEGLTQLMAGDKPKPTADGQPPASKPLADARMSYQALDRFVVTVKDKRGNDIRFVLHRQGLEWKLTEILIPTV